MSTVHSCTQLYATVRSSRSQIAAGAPLARCLCTRRTKCNVHSRHLRQSAVHPAAARANHRATCMNFVLSIRSSYRYKCEVVIVLRAMSTVCPSLCATVTHLDRLWCAIVIKVWAFLILVPWLQCCTGVLHGAAYCRLPVGYR